jgi:hypothetical protein
MILIVQTKSQDDVTVSESIEVYCQRISKRNNAILYKLEEYLDVKLLSNEHLKGIRDNILSVSADMEKLPKLIKVEGDD